MYECRHSHLFDHPDRKMTDEGPLLVCPACGTDDFELVELCSVCGLLVPAYELNDQDECEACAGRPLLPLEDIA